MAVIQVNQGSRSVRQVAGHNRLVACSTQPPPCTALYRLIPPFERGAPRSGGPHWSRLVRISGRGRGDTLKRGHHTLSVSGHSPFLALYRLNSPFFRPGKVKSAVNDETLCAYVRPGADMCAYVRVFGNEAEPRPTGGALTPRENRPHWSSDGWGLESPHDPPTEMSALRKPA